MLNVENSDNICFENSDTSSIKSVARYLHHLRSLTIIRHTFPVIIASQKHRGINLALLEGEFDYQKGASELEKEIDSRLLALKLLNRELSFPVPTLDIEQLLLEWENVKSWSGGPALENFNLHSHFIEQLLKLMWNASEKTGYFSGSVNLNDLSQPTSGIPESADEVLARFILQETPELVELIARIRGLATHVSVVGICDEEHTTWLDYLLRLLNQKKEKFRTLDKTLNRYVLRDLPVLIDMQIQDSRIVQLVQLIQDQILGKSDISLESQVVFNMATGIIDSQKEVIYQGLNFIQSRMHSQFENQYKQIS
jgi:hypothetical protein